MTTAEQNLRIAYVSARPPDPAMLAGLRGARADVVPLLPADLLRPASRRLRTERLGLVGRVVFAFRVARWLRRHATEFEVALAVDNRTAALGANLGRVLGGPPVVLQVRESGAGRPVVIGARNAGRSAVVEQVIGVLDERLADAIGATSFGIGLRCARHAYRVAIIPWCGVDLEVFGPRWSREEARRALGLPVDGNVVVGYLGERTSDPSVFIEAMAKLRARGHTVTAVALTSGPRDPVRGRRADPTVRAVADPPAAERALWYVAADAMVQPVRHRGSALPALESLACGTPVVATRSGGLLEALDGGRLGELVPPQDADAIADAVVRQLSDGWASRHAALQGRRFVQESYSSLDAFESWIALAREVAAEAASGRGGRRGARSGPGADSTKAMSW